MNTPKKKSVFEMLGGHSQGAAAPEIARKIPLSDIRLDPNQPRKNIPRKDLEDLAESIREVGIITPITVKPSGTIPPWDLVAGERRWRSATIAGLAEIPAYIRDDLAHGDSRIPLMQLIENANRQDLSDLEMARSIQKILDADTKLTGKSHGGKSRVARLINRSPQVVGRYLAMLEAPAIEWCEAGLVSSADVVQFLRSAPEAVREQLLDQARNSGEVITQAQVREATKEHANGAATDLSDSTSTSGTAPDAAGVDAGSNAAAPAGAAGGSHGDQPGAGNEELEDGANDQSGDGNSQLQSGAGDQSGNSESEDQRGDQPGEGQGGSDADHRTPTRSSSGTREKAVSLSLTGEKLEDLLRFLVDKSSDRLEVRLSADLGRAIIENLGGEVPERSETYAGLIADLLASR